MNKLISIIFVIILVHISFAGNTGKIFGTIADKTTGEPLPGVNVFLRGTPYGAASDLSGEFYLLNIPPGTYTLECAYIGYNSTILEKVQIQTDQTTILTVEMQETTMELDEEIVVIADRPLVQKDLTSSKKVTTAEEILVLPVETYVGIMLTQAGITQGADGAIHIRGGRSNETAFLVDGVSVSNPYNTNGGPTNVANNAIQEMTVVSGAFNAEYGNAMSGVVNFTTKDGSKEFNTFLSAYTGDYISNHDDIFFNINSFDPLANKNIEGTFSGPLFFVPGQNHSFFLSARYHESEGYYYGIREHLPGDSSNFETKVDYVTYKDDDDKLITVPVYNDDWDIELNGDNAIVPMNPNKDLNLMGKLKFQLRNNMELRVQTLYDQADSKSYVHDYKYNPDGTYNFKDWSIANSLQLTHTLAPSTFYELKLGYNQGQFEQYVYEDPTDPRYVPTNKIKGSPDGVTFGFGGTQMGHVYEDSKTYQGRLDFTSQIDNRNLFKVGVEARLYELARESFTIQYDRDVYRQPTIPSPESTLYNKYKKYPQQISAYVQDKIEYTDVIINAGLRYDYFFSDGQYAVNELQPDGEIAGAEPKHMLAPRLGISFPITAAGIIHFSYGHFYQMPSLRSVFVNPDFKLPATVTTVTNFGNGNLEPQLTITYELGLQQQFGDRFAIDLTGFYKDIRNLLASQTIQFRANEGDIRTYRVQRNQDYANIRGLTISLNKRMAPGDPVAAKIDYTFQVAEGNDNNSDAFFYNSLSGQENIKQILPLDWDQSHNLYTSVTIQAVRGLNLGLIWRLSTGYPYTPDVAQSLYDADVNSDRKPTTSNVDLRASYRFTIGRITYEVFAKVYNLFDTLNERYVFDDTGRASYTFANRGIQETDKLKSRYGQPGVHTWDEYNIRPQYYRAPRELRLGFSVEF
jgi:outer membrane receptor protein involved in Fe transport